MIQQIDRYGDVLFVDAEMFTRRQKPTSIRRSLYAIGAFARAAEQSSMNPHATLKRTIGWYDDR